MKFKNLKFKGITRFDQETEVNFSSLPPGLIAVIGKNGNGKTTLMESTYASLFRRLPSREGEMYEHCNGRDAFVDFTFEFSGGTYRALVNIDAEKRKQEAYIFGEDNEPLVNGKLREFDAYIREHLFTEDLFLSAIFNVQNKAGNFLELSKVDRKALFIKMLGQGKLEQYSGTAKKCSDTYTTQIEVLRSRIQDIKTALEKKKELLRSKKDMSAELKAEEKVLQKQESALQSALQEEQKHKEGLRDLEAMEEKIEALRANARDLESEKDGLEENHLEAQGASEQTIIEIEGKIQTSQEVLSRREEIEKAIEAKEVTEKANVGIETKIASLRKQVDILAAEKLKLQNLRANKTKDETQLSALKADAELIDQVPCGEQYPDCKFLQKAFAAKERIAKLEEHIRDITCEIKEVEYDEERENAVRQEIQDKEMLIRKNKEKITMLSRRASEQADLKNAETRISELKEELQKANEAHEKAKKVYALARKEKEGKGTAIEKQIIALRKQQEGLKDLKEKAELASQQKKAIEQEIESLRGTIVTMNKNLGSIDGSLAELGKQEEEKEAKGNALAAALQEKREWDILSKALGKNGIQALEIDAAGPEVSSLTNELLNSCFGTRFAISFETTRLSADQKKEVEIFEPRVIDNERSREGMVVNLSPGEKVIVGEAISLALALYNRQKSDKDIQTLFRDETAGALDEDNAQRYITMLRKAMELGEFHQVYFIAHNPELWGQADGKIFVDDDGAIRVEG